MHGTLDECFKLIKKCGRAPIISSMSIIKLAEVVQEDNSLTQKGMAQKMMESGFSISQPSVSLYLKKLDITRKRLRRVISTTQEARIINDRRLYSIKYRNVDMESLLFLDETGFNLYTRPTFGYSPKNVPAYTTVPANRSRNISLLAIISTRMIVKSKIIEGAFNSESFLCFIKNCKELGIFDNKILIMDNVKFHKSLVVMDYFRKNNIRHDFLPAYSPQLNPIEEVFSCLKSKYYAIRPFPINKEEIMRRIEMAIIDININVTMVNFYNHMKEYLDLGFNAQCFIKK